MALEESEVLRQPLIHAQMYGNFWQAGKPPMLLFHTPTGVKSVTGPLLPFHSPAKPCPLPRRLALSLGLKATHKDLVQSVLGEALAPRDFSFQRIYVN